ARSLSVSSSTAPATPQCSTLSLHDALPIWPVKGNHLSCFAVTSVGMPNPTIRARAPLTRTNTGIVMVKCWFMNVTSRRTCTTLRSEEHTSELQSRGHLVCRLLLEKKNNWHY